VVGGVSTVVLGGAGAAAFGTLAISADNPEIDDSSVRLLMEMNSYAFTLFAFGMALFVGSASLVILRTGVIWRWLAGLGLLAALLLVIGAAWPIDGDEEGAIAILGFIGAPATMLFIIISSINMIIRSEEPAPTERASSG
jgi:DMSO/TMAO reductase YedYZ heme-binding membrane subunit